MKIHCQILGYSIQQETVCTASGNNPLCRKCLGLEEKTVRPESGKKESRKRCECGWAFLPKSNRQERCERCQKQNERDKTRGRVARFRKRVNGRSLVTV
jgi:hypothetical protein